MFLDSQKNSLTCVEIRLNCVLNSYNNDLLKKYMPLYLIEKNVLMSNPNFVTLSTPTLRDRLLGFF